MPQASTLQVSLPQDVIEYIHTEMASGEYASESEVVRVSTATLQDEDAGFESWAREHALPAYNRVMDGTSRAIPINEVRTGFRHRLATVQGHSD